MPLAWSWYRRSLSTAAYKETNSPGNLECWILYKYFHSHSLYLNCLICCDEFNCMWKVILRTRIDIGVLSKNCLARLHSTELLNYSNFKICTSVSYNRRSFLCLSNVLYTAASKVVNNWIIHSVVSNHALFKFDTSSHHCISASVSASKLMSELNHNASTFYKLLLAFLKCKPFAVDFLELCWPERNLLVHSVTRAISALSLEP